MSNTTTSPLSLARNERARARDARARQTADERRFAARVRAVVVEHVTGRASSYPAGVDDPAAWNAVASIFAASAARALLDGHDVAARGDAAVWKHADAEAWRLALAQR